MLHENAVITGENVKFAVVCAVIYSFLKKCIRKLQKPLDKSPANMYNYSILFPASEKPGQGSYGKDTAMGAMTTMTMHASSTKKAFSACSFRAVALIKDIAVAVSVFVISVLISILLITEKNRGSGCPVARLC